MTKTTELATITKDQFPALAHGKDVLKTIKFNMGGEPVTPADLNRIKVPSGGGLFWAVGDKPLASIDGIIVHISRRRAYWKSSDPSNNPPDCSSGDMIHGNGNPGGECEVCPLNAFGSAVEKAGKASRGKACKETKLVFMLRAGNLLPDVISVPPGSLKDMRTWQLSLGRPYWSFASSLKLAKAVSGDGITYAQVKPATVAPLDEEAAKAIQEYAAALQGVFSAVAADDDGERV